MENLDYRERLSVRDASNEYNLTSSQAQQVVYNNREALANAYRTNTAKKVAEMFNYSESAVRSAAKQFNVKKGSAATQFKKAENYSTNSTQKSNTLEFKVENTPASEVLIPEIMPSSKHSWMKKAGYAAKQLLGYMAVAGTVAAAGYIGFVSYDNHLKNKQAKLDIYDTPATEEVSPVDSSKPSLVENFNSAISAVASASSVSAAEVTKPTALELKLKDKLNAQIAAKAKADYTPIVIAAKTDSSTKPSSNYNSSVSSTNENPVSSVDTNTEIKIASSKDSTSDVKLDSSIDSDSDSSMPYLTNVRERSSIIDSDGYVDFSKTASGFGEHFSNLGKDVKEKASEFGWMNGKTSTRAQRAGHRLGQVGSNLGYLLTFGQAFHPDENTGKNGKKENKFVRWLRSPFAGAYNLIGGAVDTVDLAAGGTIDLTLGTAGSTVKNTLEIVGDTADLAVGTVTAPVQGLERMVYHDSYLAKGLNTTVGTATRFTRNVVTFEAARNGTFDDNGNDKGVIGPATELITDYALLLGSSSKKSNDKKDNTQNNQNNNGSGSEGSSENSNTLNVNGNNHGGGNPPVHHPGDVSPGVPNVTPPTNPSGTPSIPDVTPPTNPSGTPSIPPEIPPTLP